ncbi:MAG: FAD-binding oxidoreductase [Candidatus Kapabacteria bacterium]|nr:FAD-binding oxidoreductase [Candidatus Kapabacteria bacterium]
MRSFWESQTWSESDVVIIGGGLIGMQTALELASKRPGERVMVLERGLIPSGASTRNAGFACIGSLSEVAADIDLLGRDAALDIVQMRFDGLNGLRSTCEGYDIGYLHHGGNEIFLEDHPSLERIVEINDLLSEVTGTTTFQLRSDLISAFGFADRVRHLVHSPIEGSLDSGKLVDVLWSKAQRAGVRIRTGAQVLGIEETSGGVNLTLRAGADEHLVKAGSAVIATNAWIPDLVKDHEASRIVPARGQILVTEPLAAMPLKGTYHFDEGYVYFRPVGNRILLGGARNLAFEEEQTTSHDITDLIQGALEALLREVIAPSQSNVSIDHRWSGTMAFSPSKHPIVERVSPHVVVAFGCNGMGVALSSSIAKRITEVLKY